MKPLCLLPLFFAITVLGVSSSEEYDYDYKKSYAEYFASHGYLFETHKAITKDGYILTLWRIQGKIGEKRQRKPPVLLQHGVMDNGFSWIFKKIYRNFPIMLCEAGYDVWIGNNRGTIQSLEHRDIRKYNWKNTWNRYWDFSFDEMGEYDFPSMVEHILDITDYEQVTYVGHSQGTAQFFVRASLDPDYINTKIKAFVGLSPVMYVEHAPGLFEKILAWLPFIDALYYLGMGNFWVTPGLTPFNGYFSNLFPHVLPTIVKMIAGWTKNQTLDLSRVGFLSANEPGGTSVKNLMHWLQLLRRGGFKKFDYGKKGNVERYGNDIAPEYEVTNLKQLTIPVYLLVAKCDNIVGWNDLARLLKLLPEGYKFEEVDDYGHLDYIWADDAHTKIYPQIISFINQFK
eukprot:TRINITY_DN1473_c1_g1_i2.p2 TRINITY_DN1473_c1_g1~~TRINITY_DN1473_c1_g1_i2.p2  ORF type:complete len:442 (-),score=28.45 TRINITY_DN1473_c1_g1_i2:2975-4174(-)